MSVYAISDLHLSFQQPVTPGQWAHLKQAKPMDLFGTHWRNHPQRVYEQWLACVQPRDTVLMAGDLSWGLRLEECKYDFAYLAMLPGQIVLGRGNHDLWWQSEAKIRAALPSNVTPLHHRAIQVEGKTVVSTRGWVCPGSKEFSVEDAKIYQRELCRLELALQAGKALGGEQVLMLHYRPTNDRFEKNEVIELLLAYGVTRCIYGHLHGADTSKHMPPEQWGIRFDLTSADYLQFKPLYLWEEI